MKNRLKLNFQLETAEERKQFLETYLVQFNNLTPSELATLADYLLWGKNEEGEPIGAGTGLKTRWTKEDEFESLDSLMENPNFNDLQLHTIGEATPLRKPKATFNRTAALQSCPEDLKSTFIDLWKQIDSTDLLITYYELFNGKRTLAPRQELLDRFTTDERNQLLAAAQELTQFTYLKKRHELIDLRRQQFTLKDSYAAPINTLNHLPQPNFINTITFDVDIPVYPLGLREGPLQSIVFGENLDPAHLSEENLNQLNRFLQEKRKPKPKRNFDFRELEPVYQLFLFLEDLEDRIEEAKEAHLVESNLNSLLETLEFYINAADLTEVQKEILEKKIKHEKNTTIAGYINKKYDKSYTANYISTIFRQKIIPKINEAAEFHLETVSNYFFPENFKKCSDCGRILLLHENNWVRKARSKDGFQSRCKRCEKKIREEKKKGGR